MSADPAIPRIRIGLAGLNNHGQTVLRAILEAGTLQLASVYDVDVSARERVRAAHGIRAAGSFEDLASDPDLDALALVTPNHLHAEHTLLAAIHGKHVFVEKPIANSVSDARHMIDAMRSADRVLMVGHNTRRKRAFRAAARFLQRGALGTVVAVEASLARRAGIETGLPDWKADPTRCVLLPMSQLGIHFIDVTLALFGAIERVSCIAAARAMTGGAPDAVAALLLTESGIPVTLTSYYSTPDTYVYRILGSNGHITCRANGLHAEFLEPKETVALDFSDEGYESFVLQMREFGACIQNSREPETGGQEGLHAFAVVEAMRVSADEHRSVTLRQILG